MCPANYQAQLMQIASLPNRTTIASRYFCARFSYSWAKGSDLLTSQNSENDEFKYQAFLEHQNPRVIQVYLI